MIFAAVIIVAFLIILSCYLIGLKKVFWKIMYFVTLRWLLVYIYNIRHVVEEAKAAQDPEVIEIIKECHIDNHHFEILRKSPY